SGDLARSRLLADERVDFDAAEGLGEQEALNRRAAVRAQLFQLGALLDSLCRRLHSQRVGEAGDRAHDRPSARPRQQIVDEAAVDLDLVERKALQIAEAGIAGS